MLQATRTVSRVGRDAALHRRRQWASFGRVVSALRRDERGVRAAAALLIGVGIFFRLAQYFSGRSMWLDESALALNILDKTPGGLTKTLDLGQAAPLGFLLAAKVAVSSLGKSDLAIRLVPLVFGIASLPLFYIVARKVMSHGAALGALLLFAAADGPIYYSSELKQYAGDVTAGLALLAVAVPSGEMSWRRYAAASLVGGGVLWFSHASIFVLAAIAVAYATWSVIERRLIDLVRVGAMSIVWMASFGLFYAISLRNAGSLRAKLGGVTGLQEGPSRWFHQFSGDFGTLIGLPGGQTPLPQLIRLTVAGLVVAGAAKLCWRQLPVALMLGLPILFLEAAIALKRYPNFPRTELFLVPILLLFLGAGISAVSERFKAKPVQLLACVAVTAFVAVVPVANAVRRVEQPRVTEEMKPLLRELARRWRRGDTIYVHYAAQYAFRYYAECKCLPDDGSDKPPLSFASGRRAGPDLFSPALASRSPYLIIGATPPNEHSWRETLLADVARLPRRKRVWILYSHTSGRSEIYLLRVLLPRQLDDLGTEKEEFVRPQAGLLLYDLSSSE